MIGINSHHTTKSIIKELQITQVLTSSKNVFPFFSLKFSLIEFFSEFS